MEFKDLVGEHFLSGVDTAREKINNHPGFPKYRDVVRFVIDNKTYKAIEDPRDGLRSYLGDLEVTDEKVKNNFPPQKVICKMKNTRSIELLYFVDAVTNKTVLKVGTAHVNTWYPYCIFRWQPENLAINARK
jgi:hypothetical protein